MESLPIIVIAYNRPNSLQRLLTSLEQATYPDNPIDLYISIDLSEEQKCSQIAENFAWKWGQKTILKRETHFGLFNHVMKCGDLAAKLGAAIVLEDDIMVSPAFYDFAIKATSCYKNDQEVAGISLYSYAYTENRNLPFEALRTQHDTYFMQVTSSWGQVWTSRHWNDFKSWLELHPQVKTDENIPDHLFDWGDQSWKKHFNRYLIDSGKYFVHPMQSFTTNFEDPGTHATTKGLFQVNLVLHRWEYSFDSLNTSKNRYDAWFEMKPECLKQWNPKLKEYDFVVDVYGSKNLQMFEEQIVLSTRDVSEAQMGWDDTMFPILHNIVSDQEGRGIHLCAKSDLILEGTSQRERFFRTRSLVPDYTHEEQVFHVLIPVTGSSNSDLERTIQSIEKQEYQPKNIWIIVPSSQGGNFKHLESFSNLLVASGTSETELIKEGFQRLQHGMAVCLIPGSTLVDGALSSVSEIFKCYSDMSWLIGATPDRRGFLLFNQRLNSNGMVQANTKQILPYSFTSSFFRVSWMHQKTFNEATFNEWLVSASQYDLPNLVVRKMIIESPSVARITVHVGSTNSSHIKDVLVEWLCQILGKLTNSKWPHILFGSHFGIPDSVRFDENHGTWYRERF